MTNLLMALVSLLTVGCGIAAVGLAIYGPDPLPPDLKQLYDASLAISVSGMLTLVGLVGRLLVHPR
jgi:hypothetical protein